MRLVILAATTLASSGGESLYARMVTFFNPQQVATNVASGVTSDTISSGGYLFTYTRDKLFTGGLGGGPIGRNVRVPWPTGVEAQAVTTPPAGVTDYKARIEVSRVDGTTFDLPAFTAKLLANTAGTGASIEIMPIQDGEDAFNDPFYFFASGNAGNSFSYTEAGGFLGSTAPLKGYEAYKIGLFVDFALTALTLHDAGVGLPGDFDSDADVDGADLLVWQRGATANPLAIADLEAWRAGFGSTAAAPVAETVPEPTSICLLTSASLIFIRRHRRGIEHDRRGTFFNMRCTTRGALS